MDDLDRMFRRLVHNVRNGYPEYLTRPFEVAELYQTLIPYRHNRRELGMETAQDYELVLCQLLAGGRGYLMGDEMMQQAISRELATPNPNTAIFREFAATRVALSPEALRRYDQLMANTGSSTPAATPAASAPTARSAPPAPTSPVSSEVASAPAPPPGVQATAPLGVTSNAPSPQPAAAEMPATNTGRHNAAESRATQVGAPEGVCRYCGGTLPSGRHAVFCPYCGQNLTIQRCPACSTELELDWKFCITCGRDASLG